MKKRSRLLTLLLSLAMILTFMPAIAFAEDDGDEGYEYYISIVDDNDGWMKKDGEFPLGIETDELDEAGDYDLEFALSCADWTGVEDEDDESKLSWVNLEPFEDYADYDSEKSTVTLYGAPLWAEASGYEDPKVKLEVRAIKDGDVIAYNYYRVSFEFEDNGDDYYLDLEDDDVDLFNDGDYRVTVDTSDLRDISDYKMQYSLKTFDLKDEDNDWPEEDEWIDLDNFEKYATVSGDTVILHGAKINEVTKNYSVPYVRLVAEAVKDGEAIATAYLSRRVNAPYADYNLYYDEYDLYLIGSNFYIDKYRTGDYYSGKNPNGEPFKYEVKKVTVDGAAATQDSDGWSIPITSEAARNVVITYATKEGGTETYSFTLKGIKERFYCGVYRDQDYNVAPDEKVTVKADARHIFMRDGSEVEDGSGYKFKWEVEEVKDIDDDEYTVVSDAKAYVKDAAVVTSADNMSSTYSFTVVAGPDYVDKTLRIRASIVDSNNTVLDHDFVTVGLSNEYYLIEFPKEIDNNMPVGSSVTLTPSVKKHSYTGNLKIEGVSGVKYAVWYDRDVFEVTNNGAKVESGSDYEDAKYTGSFTFKRISDESGSLEFYAYKDHSDGGWDGLCTKGFWVERVYSFRNPVVEGIVNKTFNGKAQTQEPVVTVENTYGDRFQLTEGEEYKVEYKNNVNAGTATMNFIGINDYAGSSFSKTFTIAKAKGTMTASGKTVKLKAKNLKKKAQTIKPAKAYKVSGTKGKVTYKLAKVKKSKFKKYFKVDAKTGKIKVKKGLKKGTYKVSVKVADGGNKNYAAVTKTVTVKVTVK